jgi:cell division septation protein DedD
MLFHVPSFSIGLVLGAAIVLTTGYLPELLAPPPDPTKTATNAGAAEPAQQPLRFEFDTILRTTPAPVTAGTADAGQTEGTAPGGADGLAPGAAGTVAGADAADATGAAPGLPTGELESATPGILDAGGPAVTTSVPVATGTTALPGAPSTGSGTPNGSPNGSPVGVEERPVPADRAATAAAEPAAPAPAAAQPEPTASYMLQAASFRSRADADRLRAELLLLDLPATTGEVNVGNSVWYRVTVGPFPDQPSTDAARERLRERNLTAIPFRR